MINFKCLRLSYFFCTIAFIASLFSFIAQSSADVIQLKSGHQVKGDVLVERDGILMVDIGVDVLRIPVSQIKSRTKDEKSSKNSVPLKIVRNKIYSTASFPRRNIKDLTTKLSECVVLVETPSGLGSGFVISEQGHCITNYHVVERETRLAVTIFRKNSSGGFTKQRIKNIKIVALNPFFDLALLQIPKQKGYRFKTASISEKENYEEGSEVFAIGNPLGLERSVSRGIIGNKNRNFQGLVYIQTTTQINPGNSGGPLFNFNGEVIGVTNMKLVFAEGLGFAIPAAYLKHFLNNYEAFAFDEKNPNTGFRYIDAPKRKNFNKRERSKK